MKTQHAASEQVSNARRGQVVWWREDASSIMGGMLEDVSGSIATVCRCGQRRTFHVARVHLRWRDAFDQAIEAAAAREQSA